MNLEEYFKKGFEIVAGKPSDDERFPYFVFGSSSLVSFCFNENGEISIPKDYLEDGEKGVEKIESIIRTYLKSHYNSLEDTSNKPLKIFIESDRFNSIVEGLVKKYPPEIFKNSF